MHAMLAWTVASTGAPQTGESTVWECTMVLMYTAPLFGKQMQHRRQLFCMPSWARPASDEPTMHFDVITSLLYRPDMPYHASWAILLSCILAKLHP